MSNHPSTSAPALPFQPSGWARSLGRLWRRTEASARPAPDVRPEDALAIVQQRRLIFVVSTGRSGTEYLAKVLGLFEDVHAEHEPEPSFTNAFRTIAAAPDLARQFWLDHKLPAIARSSAPVYAETSHLACKGFLESAVDLGLRPTLVHLFRPYRSTAKSMLALKTIPGRTFNGVRFYLGPEDRVMLPIPRNLFQGWHDYQLCYWYCLEIGERARVYEEGFRPLGIQTERVELASIETAQGVEALGARLGLGALSKAGTTRMNEVVGRETNTKANAKRQTVLTDADFGRLEAEVEEAVALGRGRALREVAG